MSQPHSIWKIPLVKELAIILVLKLVILFSIKAIWFNEPTIPVNGTEKLDQHLFGAPAPSPANSDEEIK
ncbi:cytochrome oxidase putative small subunit CydP [Pseudomonas sp. F1_0610]|uniref:cytochrome oxidase putative small subunit CydP n=1 Tax=Pseudomonas sp. F1_0610 TaxID=3114284 RepID=UPI0039C24EA1